MANDTNQSSKGVSLYDPAPPPEDTCGEEYVDELRFLVGTIEAKGCMCGATHITPIVRIGVSKVDGQSPRWFMLDEVRLMTFVSSLAAAIRGSQMMPRGTVERLAEAMIDAKPAGATAEVHRG